MKSESTLRCSSTFDIKKKPEHTLVGSGNSLLITSKQFTSRTWARTLTTAWSSSLKLQTGMAYRMLYNTPDKQKRSSPYLDQMRTCFTGWIWKKKDVPLMNVIHFSIQSRLTYCWHSNVSRVASYRSTMHKPSAFFKTLITIIIVQLFQPSLKYMTMINFVLADLLVCVGWHVIFLSTNTLMVLNL